MRTKERQITYLKGQIKRAELRALYWMAEATTGAITRRKMQQGREPNEEEKAKGHCIGWRDKSDQEKIADALETANRHIHIHEECCDSLDTLLKEQDEALSRS